MWTKKNNKGAKITKKEGILRNTVNTTHEAVIEIPECTGDPDIAILLEEIPYHLTPTQLQIITTVVQDPTLVKPCGKLNVKQISEYLNLTWFETNRQIKGLGRLLENEL